MKAYKILYKNASGTTSLTQSIEAANPASALLLTTPFVRQNYVDIYEVETEREMVEISGRSWPLR